MATDAPLITAAIDVQTREAMRQHFEEWLDRACKGEHTLVLLESFTIPLSNDAAMHFKEVTSLRQTMTYCIPKGA